MTRISPRARMGPCHVCGFNGMRRQMVERDGRWVCRKITDCTDRVLSPQDRCTKAMPVHWCWCHRTDCKYGKPRQADFTADDWNRVVGVTR